MRSVRRIALGLIVIAVTPAAAREPMRAALYVSAADSSFLHSVGADYSRALQLWTADAATLGFAVERVRCMPRPIEASQDTPPVLILPHAYAFAPATWDSLIRFVESGGRVLAFGALGVRDGASAWLGWQRCNDLLGARVAHEMAAEQTGFLTLGATTPFASVALHGRVLGHIRMPGAIGIEVERPLAWWSTWDRIEHPVAGRPLAAATRTMRGAGRILWFGFAPHEMNSSDTEGADTRAWFHGLGAWLAGSESHAGLDPWPGAAEAAALIEEDSEDHFENVEILRAELERRGLRGTFLCVSNLAQRHPALVRRLAARHEVGSHTDDHRVLDGVALDEQRAHLSRSRDALEAISGVRATTFRAPEERTDANTLVALAEAGFECVVAGNGRTAMPEIVAVPLPPRTTPANIVRIPRIVSDDYDWFVHSQISADSVAPRLRQALARTRRIGGVLVVSLHTQLAGTPEHIGAVTPFLDDLVQQPIWITTAGEVAHWWKQRDACPIAITSRRGLLTLTVEKRRRERRPRRLHAGFPERGGVALSFRQDAGERRSGAGVAARRARILFAGCRGGSHSRRSPLRQARRG